jgi:hypothetical protein
LKKEKKFLTPIWQWAEIQLEAEPDPASRSLSSPFLHSLTTHDTAQPTIHSPVRGLLANCPGLNFFFIRAARQGISSVLAAAHLGPAAAHRSNDARKKSFPTMNPNGTHRTDEGIQLEVESVSATS